MENRNGLLVDFQILEANGTVKRRTAIEMGSKPAGGQPHHLGRGQGL
jgi:hypothetical protein